MTEDEIPALLACLRTGDANATERVILGHVRLAMQIVGRYLHRLKSDRLSDLLVSAALEGIIDAVHRVSAGSMEHDNLSGYVTDYIHRYVSRALEDVPTVRVPRTTQQSARYRGETVRRPSRVGFDDPDLLRRTAKHDDINDFEIKEIIDKIIQSDLERRILELRQEGQTDAEIATALSLSKTSVFLIRKQVERRFLELFYNGES